MREQLLAARNFMMGTTNILLFTVPDTWSLADGYASPEVEEWTEYSQRRWMARGRAPYRLVEPHPEQPGLVRAEVELLVTAVPWRLGAPGPGRFRLVHVADSGWLEWSGHPVEYAFGTVKRGFFPSREVEALHLRFECQPTARRITLELTASYRGGSGAATRQDLEALLAALGEGVCCH